MVAPPFSCHRPVELASGLDALYLWGRGVVPGGLLADLERFKLLAAEAGGPVDVHLVGYPLRVLGSGWGKYRYCAVHELARVGFTPSDALPCVRVQPTSLGLHALGPDVIVLWVRNLLDALGIDATLTVARLDLHADYQQLAIEAEERSHFVGYSNQRALYEVDEALSGLNFGTHGGAIYARIYDKTRELDGKGDDWWLDVWGTRYEANRPVIRDEFEFSRDGLGEFDSGTSGSPAPTNQSCPRPSSTPPTAVTSPADGAAPTCCRAVSAVARVVGSCRSTPTDATSRSTAAAIAAKAATACPDDQPANSIARHDSASIYCAPMTSCSRPSAAISPARRDRPAMGRRSRPTPAHWRTCDESATGSCNSYSTTRSPASNSPNKHAPSRPASTHSTSTSAKPSTPNGAPTRSLKRSSKQLPSCATRRSTWTRCGRTPTTPNAACSSRNSSNRSSSTPTGLKSPSPAHHHCSSNSTRSASDRVRELSGRWTHVNRPHFVEKYPC